MKRFTSFKEVVIVSRPFILLLLPVFFAIIGCGSVSPSSETAAPPSQPRAIFLPSAEQNQIVLNLEVARTSEEKTRGLMDRKSLAADEGMIFVFDRPVTMSFWMKDTYIPLSIAFVSGEGTIVDIQDMSPLSTEIHAPAAAYTYAIEVNQGYFSANRVKKGDAVKLEGI